MTRGIVLAAAGVAAVLQSRSVLPEAEWIGWIIGVGLILLAIIVPPVFAARYAYNSIPPERKAAKWRSMVYVLLVTMSIQFAVLSTGYSVVKSDAPRQATPEAADQPAEHACGDAGSPE
jgi:uncharacterized membrane protein YdfJ with MMPL/SSD domain